MFIFAFQVFYLLILRLQSEREREREKKEGYLITYVHRSLDYLHQYKSQTKKGIRQRVSSIHSSSSSSFSKRTSSGSNLQAGVGGGGGGVSPGSREKLSSSLVKSKGRVGGAGTVLISDISSLLPIDYNLAKSYR